MKLDTVESQFFEPPRKSKLVQIIGRFKESGVKLQLLTGERKIRFVPKSEFYLKPVELKIESRLIKKRVQLSVKCFSSNLLFRL